MEREKHRSGDEILPQWKGRYEELLEEALSEKLDLLFENPTGETWAEVRMLVADETESAVSKLLADISRVELDPETSNILAQNLRDYGRNVVERKAREVAGKVHLQQRMKDRFASILNEAHVRGTANKKTPEVACVECLKLLSVMVAIRLDDKTPVKIESNVSAYCKEKLDKYDKKTESSSDTDKRNKILGLSKGVMDKMGKKLISSIKDKKNSVIENMLISSLMGKKSSSKNTLDSASTWPEVSPEDTLIKPAECKVLWERFQAEILSLTEAFAVTLAGSKQARASYMSLAAAVAGVSS